MAQQHQRISKSAAYAGTAVAAFVLFTPPLLFLAAVGVGAVAVLKPEKMTGIKDQAVSFAADVKAHMKQDFTRARRWLKSKLCRKKTAAAAPAEKPLPLLMDEKIPFSIPGSQEEFNTASTGGPSQQAPEQKAENKLQPPKPKPPAPRR
jgi:hypothetical protein